MVSGSRQQVAETVTCDALAVERGGAAGVRVRGLVKRYPKARVNAVDNVSFDVEAGTILGLLGPNGAGKSTTIGVLTTRVRPDGGQVSIADIDVIREPETVRRVLGVVPQRDNLELALSVRQNLLFHAAYHGIGRKARERRTDELLEQFELGNRAKDKPGRLSGGQFRRVMIARALMHDPAVLFLDEPSTGLDPAARQFVWQKVREMRARGVTILLTTHDMEEAAALSDRVGVMDHGRLLVLDRPEELVRTLTDGSTLEVSAEIAEERVPPLVRRLGELDGVERCERTGGSPPAPTIRLQLSGAAARLVAPVALAVEEFGGRLTGVDIGGATLEDVFIHLTGRRLR